MLTVLEIAKKQRILPIDRNINGGQMRTTKNQTIEEEWQVPRVGGH